MEFTLHAKLIYAEGDLIDYWRDRNDEVDFIFQSGKKIIPMEVKSYYRKTTHPGTEAFCQRYKVLRTLLIGGQGLPIEKFLSESMDTWVQD